MPISADLMPRDVAMQTNCSMDRAGYSQSRQGYSYNLIAQRQTERSAGAPAEPDESRSPAEPPWQPAAALKYPGQAVLKSC